MPGLSAMRDGPVWLKSNQRSFWRRGAGRGQSILAAARSAHRREIWTTP